MAHIEQFILETKDCFHKFQYPEQRMILVLGSVKRKEDV
jgi:hypothetical protein